MAYAPGPVATTPVKPSRWNADFGLVRPEWQWFWTHLASAYLFWEGSGPTVTDIARWKQASVGNAIDTWNDPVAGLWGDSLGAFAAFDEDAWLDSEYDPDLASRPWTVFVRFAGSSSIDAQFNMLASVAEKGTNDPALIFGTDNAKFEYFVRDDAGNEVDFTEAGDVDVNRARNAIITKDSAGDVKVYLDGEEVGSHTGFTGNFDFSGYPFYIGARNSRNSATNLWRGSLSAIYFLDGLALSERQVRDLEADPFGPFRPNFDYVEADTGGTITVPLLEPTTVYSPQVDGQIQVDHLGPTATVHSPSVAAGITVPHLGPTATVHQPTQVAGDITVPLLQPTTIYGPSVGGQIVVDHLGPTASVHSPQVDGGITVGLIQTTTVYSPQVDASIVVDHLGPTAVVYQPTVAEPAADTITVPLLEPTTVYAPQIDGQVVVPHLGPTASVYNPELAAKVAVPHLQPTTVYSPQLDATITVPVIQTTVLYQPTLASASVDIVAAAAGSPIRHVAASTALRHVATDEPLRHVAAGRPT